MHFGPPYGSLCPHFGLLFFPGFFLPFADLFSVLLFSMNGRILVTAITRKYIEKVGQKCSFCQLLGVQSVMPRNLGLSHQQRENT